MAEREGHGLGFKRSLVLPGIFLTLVELVVVVLPLLQLFRPTAEQRELLWKAVGPVFAVGFLLWLAGSALRLAPVQRAVLRRRREEALEPELERSAYRAVTIWPLEAMGLRTGLWIAAAIAFGWILGDTTGWTVQRTVTLASVTALHAVLANTVRAVWYARVARRLRQQLFPDLSPIEDFSGRYFRRIVLVAVVSGGAAVAAHAAFIYYFLPIGAEEYLTVQTFLPGALAVVTVLWVEYARRKTAPLRRYLESELGSQDRRGGPSPQAVVAYRVAQALPYRLALARVVAWIGATAGVAWLARSGFRMETDNAVILFGAAVVILVGSSLYEAIWHRDTMKPILQHLADRHRLPVRSLRTALSFRAKLLLSFGGLVLFACGLSLFWGFVQYKKLATRYVDEQTKLKVDWIASEVLRLSMEENHRPNKETVLRVLEQAASPTNPEGAVYAYAPVARSEPTLSLGGGEEGAPRLPWYATARMRAKDRGKLEIGSLRLEGNFQKLRVDTGGSPVELGAVAVLYPGYRGRGPGLQRPLLELFVFFLVLFGASGGIVALTVRQFTSPIRNLEQRADEMARGELSQPVQAAGEADELGRLTSAIEEMRQALREKIRTIEDMNVDLEKQVEHRTADLARKNRELADALEKLKQAQTQLIQSEKLASIGQLVAGIAHEINNPVNAVVNTVGPLSEAIEAVARAGNGVAAADEIKDMVAVIQRGARRTKDIVQALHNYSRTDEERLVEFDLNRSVDDSLELLRHQLKGVIDVERDYGEVGRIQGHAGQLNQVFMNLLTNAAQALAGKDGARILVSTRKKGDQVVIQVADNGPGIPDKDLPRIFDPFFTTKEVGKGTGLGLAIVHGIVERHGGTIEVDTAVGKGTTFTVTLPATQRG